MKKRFLSLLSGLYMFTLVSCSSSPRVLNKKIECKDSMIFSDVKVDDVINEKETLGETGSAETYLDFHFNVKNESQNITTTLSYSFNIKDTSNKNVLATNPTNYLNDMILYPGDSFLVSARIYGTPTYAFTTLETYTISDLKADEAVGYSSDSIYSTSASEESGKKIEVTDLRVRYISGSESNYLYRIDYSMNYDYEHKENDEVWLYYPKSVLKIGDKQYVLSNMLQTEASELTTYYYLTTDQELDLTQEKSLEIKACLATTKMKYDDTFTVFLSIVFGFVIIGAPVIAGLVVLIVLSCQKSKKKKDENENK